METEGETGIEMSRPKVPRRLNLEMGHHLVRANVPVGPEISSMSPMTNLVHNLSGASLDSTPKRRLHSQGEFIRMLVVCLFYLASTAVFLEGIICWSKKLFDCNPTPTDRIFLTQI